MSKRENLFKGELYGVNWRFDKELEDSDLEDFALIGRVISYILLYERDEEKNVEITLMYPNEMIVWNEEDRYADSMNAKRYNREVRIYNEEIEEGKRIGEIREFASEEMRIISTKPLKKSKGKSKKKPKEVKSVSKSVGEVTRKIAKRKKEGVKKQSEKFRKPKKTVYISPEERRARAECQERENNKQKATKKPRQMAARQGRFR